MPEMLSDPSMAPHGDHMVDPLGLGNAPAMPQPVAEALAQALSAPTAISDALSHAQYAPEAN
jgi:hypothetical protein